MLGEDCWDRRAREKSAGTGGLGRRALGEDCWDRRAREKSAGRGLLGPESRGEKCRERTAGRGQLEMTVGTAIMVEWSSQKTTGWPEHDRPGQLGQKNETGQLWGKTAMTGQPQA